MSDSGDGTHISETMSASNDGTRPQLAKSESLTPPLDQAFENGGGAVEISSNPMTNRNTMERNWENKTAPTMKPTSKTPKTDMPTAQEQAGHAALVFFTVQLWRGVSEGSIFRRPKRMKIPFFL